MTIEILCDGCVDCEIVKGKVCQAVADLNLNVEISSNHDPKRHRDSVDCGNFLRMRINGVIISTRSDCSVQDLMLIFNKDPQLYS
jgi:hypothetical protein